MLVLLLFIQAITYRINMKYVQNFKSITTEKRGDEKASIPKGNGWHKDKQTLLEISSPLSSIQSYNWTKYRSENKPIAKAVRHTVNTKQGGREAAKPRKFLQHLPSAILLNVVPYRLLYGNNKKKRTKRLAGVHGERQLPPCRRRRNFE